MGGIEIAGHHVALASLLARHLIGVAAADGAEAELHLQLPFHRHDRHLVDAEGELEAQPRVDRLDHLAEALHDADALRADGVDHPEEAADQPEEEDRGQRCQPRAPRREAWE